MISTTTTNYAYGDSNWKDKLTSYDGKAITYDEIGNPLSYRNMTMTWQNGRQLATLQKGNTAVSYTYDANNVRASKTVNGEKYTYQYLDGKLIHETRGEKSFNYYYDANGYLTAIKYRLTPTGDEYSYYVTHNWRGDVIGIYSGSGVLTAKYEYDTWGNVKSIKDGNGNRITDQNNVGNLNPFRYRGYYYDTESKLYYLMSRYYDPVTHRFINADGYFKTGEDLQDTNMTSYCKNNPVNCSDPTGEWCHILEGGRMGPMCPVNMVTGFCPVCHSWDCCMPPKKPKKKPVHNTTTSTAQQDKFNTGSNITNGFVGGMKAGVNLIGKDLEATSAAALSGASYAVTAPVAITFHWINPGLTASQKWIMTGIEALNAVGGVILAFSIANCWNPLGLCGILVSLEYSVLSWAVTNTLQGNFIEENKRNGII